MENDETVDAAESKTIKVTDALLTIERKLAFARDYQSANIIQATIQYIESLEEKVGPEEEAAPAEPNDPEIIS